MPANFKFPVDDILFLPPGHLKGTIILEDTKEFCMYHCDTLNFYAVTISLHPSESEFLKKHDKDKFLYFIYKLKSLGYVGVCIGEYTKKGEPHIHGIMLVKDVVSHEPIRSRKGIIKYYVDTKLFSSNVIKPINASRAVDGWLKYMTKNFMSPNVLEWLDGYVDGKT